MPEADVVAFATILEARQRIAGSAHVTPVLGSSSLGRELGVELFFKAELFQKTGSFKTRGVLNKLARLSAAEKARGLVTISAGNHAAAIAWAAAAAGVACTVVMPAEANPTKVRVTRAYGAEVVLHGDAAQAFARCFELAQERGLCFVHPFDDPLVIAGQGTIGAEILRQSHGRLGAVFVPVGGGGLIAGVAAYVKCLMPGVRVIGVEPFEADAMYRSLAAGRRVRLDQVGIFADGVAVRQVGEETFKLCKQFVDDMIVVTNDEICAAIKDIFEDRRSILEPAGALAYAGLKRYAEGKKLKDKNFIAIASGANVNGSSSHALYSSPN